MKRLLSVILVLMMVFTLPMEICSAKTKTVKASLDSKFSDSRAITIGTTKVNLESSSWDVWKSVLFTANKSGTYKFKISSAKVNNVEVGGINVYVYKGLSDAPDKKYNEIYLNPVDNEPMSFVFVSNSYELEDNMNTSIFVGKPTYDTTFKVKLKAGETIALATDHLYTFLDGNGQDANVISHSGSYKVKITKVK